METWISELIRIIIVSLLGAALVFLGQPWLYRSGIISPSDVDPENWIGSNYTNGAAIVFSVAVVSTILWYVIGAKAKIKGASQASNIAFLWWLFMLLPILGIGVSLYFFNGSKDALLSLASFYVLDVLFLFWFSTALSSPEAVKFIVPGSFFLRRLFRLG